MPQPRDRKPILWAFSLSRLNDLLERVVPSYAGRAHIRVFDKGFDEAVEVARTLMRAGEEVDVIISAGANGAFLKKRATVPVVTIQPTGFDVLQALAKARRLSRRVAIVNHGQVTPELEHFKSLYGLEIEQRAYETVEEADACVRELAKKGIEVIVGPSAVTELSERAGLRWIFLYSQTAVCEAIDRAIEIARATRVEDAKRERVDAILRHLAEGVVAVDREHRIQSINPAMERLLGISAEQAIGVPLARVAPALSLSRVLDGGDAELEKIERLGRRTLVTNRIPIQEQGVRTGAVLTCQDASAIERVDRSLRSQHRPRRFEARHRLSDIIGRSDAIRRTRALAERYARTDATVLVTGASGTGKELFAQGIHSASRRGDRPFVAVNCAALPETLLESELFGYEEGAFTGSRRGGKPGLFEAAHTGTIFLDEVGDMPLALQTRLLRVLQQREVLRLGSNDPTPIDVRVVAATNHDLAARVEEGAFREDLYYRLNILRLHLPPLAARPEDIPLIATHLLERALEQHGALAARDRALRAILPRLAAHAWPGNVRELENVLERVAVLYAEPDGGEVDARELRVVVPELFEGRRRPSGGPTLRAARRGHERAHIQRVLEECGGNQAAAARRLGIGRTTLWRKLGSPE
ncbi:propionate catabolism operon regulatory protein PrpR [Anaeromyxobacter oryzae]|uniref:Propionate catabolism operon regulatory protein PrpR n=1 Tax=Anaeromyxobacter oryzae TaxID=2918170 RepID=A0ABN6MSA6_9BACT|nr:propionate catabolism operon regulatory protein PrpR [Anaeromyxobacter oryzae]BDG03160.1 propionate catabolism operon regulatory protein PrpR [Anaeromyxobacter oryzae]